MKPRSAQTLIRSRGLGLTMAVLALGLLGPGRPAPAQPLPEAVVGPEHGNVPCENCHARPDPTTEDAALRPCARLRTVEFAQELSTKLGPSIVILDGLVDLYLPVPFDHKGHAEMAAMTKGCAVCHHYTPEGLEHPACRTCHEVSPEEGNIRKPSLKGAYHRQCLNCHRDWAGQTQCEACHRPKAAPGQQRPQAIPTPGDLIDRMHPPIPEPEVETYLTRGKGPDSSRVIFRHREHIHRFGLRCAECHHEDNCLRCHEEDSEHTQQVRTVEQHHRPCASCHDVDSKDACKKCHWHDGEPKPPPFDHATTGWPLGRHHRDRNCRQCHRTVPFTRPDRRCESCHRDWEVDRFDHAVTGQILDENHREQECEECHVDRDFSSAPTCDECHDEDEGISFPQKRPGPVPDRAAPGRSKTR